MGIGKPQTEYSLSVTSHDIFKGSRTHFFDRGQAISLQVNYHSIRVFFFATGKSPSVRRQNCHILR